MGVLGSRPDPVVASPAKADAATRGGRPRWGTRGVTSRQSVRRWRVDLSPVG